MALCVDVEDKPSDRHNAVTQTTNGFCSDLETIVIMVDRYIMATMSNEDRLLGSFTIDPDNAGGVLLPCFPCKEHQSCWDAIDGLDATLMSEYVEVAHVMNVE